MFRRKSTAHVDRKHVCKVLRLFSALFRAIAYPSAIAYDQALGNKNLDQNGTPCFPLLTSKEPRS